MIRRHCLWGVVLLAFGAGVLLGVLLGGGWLAVLLGLGAAVAGGLILKKG